MGKLFPAALYKLSRFLILLLVSRQLCNGICTRTPTSQCFVGQSAHQHTIKILHLD